MPVSKKTKHTKVYKSGKLQYTQDTKSVDLCIYCGGKVEKQILECQAIKEYLKERER